MIWQPFARVLAFFLVPVHFWRGKREVQQVAGERLPERGGSLAKPAVMRLAQGHDVLDVGFFRAGETGFGVRPVNLSALLFHNELLDRGRVRVILS